VILFWVCDAISTRFGSAVTLTWVHDMCTIRPAWLSPAGRILKIVYIRWMQSYNTALLCRILYMAYVYAEMASYLQGGFMFYPSEFATEM